MAKSPHSYLKMIERSSQFQHSSVLVDEILDTVSTVSRGIMVDATLGLGGHTEAILDLFPDVEVVGIDQDLAAAAIAIERLARFGERFKFVHSNFEDIEEVLKRCGSRLPTAIIADLGVSSMQLDDESRGFSFRFDSPLDMRMDAGGDVTAADLIRTLDETQLADIIYKYGEERASRRIARGIKYRLENGDEIETTGQLAKIIERSIGRGKKDKIHPATRTFQALRIAVNREIDVITPFIRDSVENLAPGGVLAIISFHSIEDRVVKQAFRRFSGKCECPPRAPICTCGAVNKVEIVTKRPIVPTDSEIENNPRARSAKLRVCRKI